MLCKLILVFCFNYLDDQVGRKNKEFKLKKN